MADPDGGHRAGVPGPVLARRRMPRRPRPHAAGTGRTADVPRRGGALQPRFGTVSAALEAALVALAHGRMILITGGRLRGGDIALCLAARHVTPEAVNFMATHG